MFAMFFQIQFCLNFLFNDEFFKRALILIDEVTEFLMISNFNEDFFD
jgi:hypothetical protein